MTKPALLISVWAIPAVLLAGSLTLARAAERMSAAHSSIQADEASRHVHALADDSFEGREGGSRGGRAAGAYIVAALEKLAVEPAGDNGTFFQSFGGMRNILALVPGSDPTVAKELVVVGAHYDHVGYGNASNSYGPPATSTTAPTTTPQAWPGCSSWPRRSGTCRAARGGRS